METGGRERSGTTASAASLRAMNLALNDQGRQRSGTINSQGSHSGTVYNVLHGGGMGDIAEGDEGAENVEEDDDDELAIHRSHKHALKSEVLESFDFNDQESLAWRKHQYRRFFQGKGKYWTASRATTFWTWILVISTGLLVAFTGALVAVFTEALTEWKV